MRVNFNVSVKGFDGKESGNNLGTVLGRNIFFFADSPGFQLPYEDKYKAYQLGKRISESDGEIEITTEEATLIKRIASVVLTIGGYGQVVDLIEGA